MNNSVLFVNSIKSPCVKDCPGRSSDCRKTCEPFKKYEALKKEDYARRLEKALENEMMDDIESQRIQTYKRKRTRKMR